ncbi:uncharacterized protein LY79DRAFT_543799 [Colletotrichum navitas]|uniref:Uncharacterized protein n=1 Tax=Colletotrichum navitas TaxID=681940 RepID=A0AAD8V9C7_9PEZI|nr:uncharacterized protein LY79DRAFT_543799 [Colletotrichum navitas]KAK1596646.1 hypothetical protein LY79DRAFT_543799 [Colletotrichum navitas]
MDVWKDGKDNESRMTYLAATKPSRPILPTLGAYERKLVVLAVTVAVAVAAVPTTDVPEKRRVKQMLYKDEVKDRAGSPSDCTEKEVNSGDAELWWARPRKAGIPRAHDRPASSCPIGFILPCSLSRGRPASRESRERRKRYSSIWSRAS